LTCGGHDKVVFLGGWDGRGVEERKDELGYGERLMRWWWSSRWYQTLKGFTFQAVTTFCNTDCMGGHGGFLCRHRLCGHNWMKTVATRGKEGDDERGEWIQLWRWSTMGELYCGWLTYFNNLNIIEKNNIDYQIEKPTQLLN